MNGPEHYREAERLVAHSQNHTDQGNVADDTIAALAAAQAQVHATLAQVAATANADHHQNGGFGSQLADPPNSWDDGTGGALTWEEALK